MEVKKKPGRPKGIPMNEEGKRKLSEINKAKWDERRKNGTATFAPRKVKIVIDSAGEKVVLTKAGITIERAARYNLQRMGFNEAQIDNAVRKYL